MGYGWPFEMSEVSTSEAGDFIVIYSGLAWNYDLIIYIFSLG